MHILNHDFCGYPYPIELSRCLAARGHKVDHVWCSSFGTTPGGNLRRRASDPELLSFVPIQLSTELKRYDYFRRWRQERQYGQILARAVERLSPDVVISSNTPLDSQSRLIAASQQLGIPAVFWVQDLISIATRLVLRKKLRFAGDLIGRYYMATERRLLKQSSAVVPISDDFLAQLERWGVPQNRITTIENWAPVADIPLHPKSNAWARAHGLDQAFVFLYAGTLGLKHNPELLAALAENMQDRPDVRVVVISRGPGIEHLRAEGKRRGLSNLLLKDFEPFEQMPDVMASADALVAILESDAGTYSVPSKVLAYLCAGRPLLCALPEENLAARIVQREGAGLVAPPDTAEFIDAARYLLDSPQACRRMGKRGRSYAEQAFEIDGIADQFETVLRNTIHAKDDGDAQGRALNY